LDRIPFLDLGAMHAELTDRLDESWRNVTSAGHFIGGPAVDEFEAAWANYCGRRFAVGTASGTDAIRLTLQALDLGPGAEVVVPANTFIATCEAVTAVGATPVFADVDPATLLMTPATLEAVLTPITRAVIPVHLYGNCVDMPAIMQLAEAHDLLVVEDAAQAHGARWDGRPAGSFGQAAAFSFYPGKNLGAFGDGGAVVTDDPEIAERVRCLGNHGRSPSSHTEHVADGTNSRLDALQASVLNVKLDALDGWNQRRRQVAAWYRQYLPDDLDLLPWSDRMEPVYHLAIIRVDDRATVRSWLADRGVATGVHYPVACHHQPPFARFGREALPATEQAAAEVLSLPMYPHLAEEQVRVVATRLAESMPAQRTTSRT
jgi:dTDP-4-amino-4,6-dideoxygalactose transaminase